MPVSHQKLLIRSQDRQTGTSENFTIESFDILDGEYKVDYIMFPATIYNVNDYNNTFIFNEGGGAINATLTKGNYDVTTFPVHLGAVMTGLSGVARTYTATIDAATRKLTVTNNLSGTTSLTLSAPAAKLLGFTGNFASAHPIQGTLIVDLSMPVSIGVRIDGSSTLNAQNVVGGACAAICIPINRTFGSYVTILYNDFPQHIKFTNRARNFRVSLIDLSSGLPVSMNGGDWEFILSYVPEFPKYSAPPQLVRLF